MSNVETVLECESLAYWSHIHAPLDNAAVYEQLVGGLMQAKADYRAALVVHDRARAGRVLVEIADLTALCAAAAEGLAEQRRRTIASGRVWPW